MSPRSGLKYSDSVWAAGLLQSCRERNRVNISLQLKKSRNEKINVTSPLRPEKSCRSNSRRHQCTRVRHFKGFHNDKNGPPRCLLRDTTLRSRLFSEERVKVKVNSVRPFCTHPIDLLYYSVLQTQMRLLGGRSGVVVRNVEDGQTVGLSSLPGVGNDIGFKWQGETSKLVLSAEEAGRRFDDDRESICQ